jgi:hypothetical protein
MTLSHTQTNQESRASEPAYRKVQRVFFAAGIVLAPLTLTLYATLAPQFRGGGSAAIAANMATNVTTNQLHLVFGVATGFLLPIGFLGMAILAMKRSPWLATLGGMLGLVGWLPWAPLIALEALTYDMAQMGGGAQFVALWDRFNGDGVMTFFLFFYIVCHLISAVLLGIALGRARVVPWWSAWALVISSPITMIAFAVHNVILFYIVYALFIINGLPTAFAMLRGSGKDDAVDIAEKNAS